MFCRCVSRPDESSAADENDTAHHAQKPTRASRAKKGNDLFLAASRQVTIAAVSMAQPRALNLQLSARFVKRHKLEPRIRIHISQVHGICVVSDASDENVHLPLVTITNYSPSKSPASSPLMFAEQGRYVLPLGETCALRPCWKDNNTRTLVNREAQPASGLHPLAEGLRGVAISFGHCHLRYDGDESGNTCEWSYAAARPPGRMMPEPEM